MVTNVHSVTRVISDGSVNQRFDIGFDFHPSISGIDVLVNGAPIPEAEYEGPMVDAQGGYYITTATGHNIAVDAEVIIVRRTRKIQPIDYKEGSSVAQKAIVDVLDRLTYISQESSNRLLSTGDTVQVNYAQADVSWGLSIQVPSIAGNDVLALVTSAYNEVEGTKLNKENLDILISPAKFVFDAGVGDKFYYPYIVLPSDWTGVAFYEAGVPVKFWMTGPLVNSNEDRIFYRTRPILKGTSLTTIVRRFA